MKTLVEFVLGIAFLCLLLLGLVALSENVYVMLAQMMFVPFGLSLVFYGLVALTIIVALAYRRFGIVAGAVAFFAGWVGMSLVDGYQAHRDRVAIEAEDAGGLRPQADGIGQIQQAADAITIPATMGNEQPHCDHVCAELLVTGAVKTVFAQGTRNLFAMTLGTSDACDGLSQTLSQILRDNNRFDLCIRVERTTPDRLRGLRIEPVGERLDTFRRTLRLSGHRVSQWNGREWMPVYQRRHGKIATLAPIPAFMRYFTGSGEKGVAWVRHTTKVGVDATREDVLAQALSVSIAGTFNTRTVERRGTTTYTKPVTPPPAPAADHVAAIDRMSRDPDVKVRRQAGQEIGRFIKDHGTLEPVRSILARLFADPGGEVKDYAYQGIANAQIAVDAELLQSIMAGGPNWQASGLAAIMSKLSEDEIRPYEDRMVAAVFEIDPQRYAKRNLVRALPAMSAEALNGLFARCSELSDAMIFEISEFLTHNTRQMPEAQRAKLYDFVVPCLAPRMQTVRLASVSRIVQGLERFGATAVVIDGIEQRLARADEELAAAKPYNKSETQGAIDWLRKRLTRLRSRPSG